MEFWLGPARLHFLLRDAGRQRKRFTVHSAGSQVLLHNGDPLYGYGPLAQRSFAPLMRLTNVVIDQAGNIWALNNWKPDFDIDACCNPGGDGAVIFIRLAPPPALQK